ncbi:hypothetical protein, partial [Nocardia sp. NPDC055049]
RKTIRATPSTRAKRRPSKSDPNKKSGRDMWCRGLFSSSSTHPRRAVFAQLEHPVLFRELNIR